MPIVNPQRRQQKEINSAELLSLLSFMGQMFGGPQAGTPHGAGPAGPQLLHLPEETFPASLQLYSRAQVLQEN